MQLAGSARIVKNPDWTPPLYPLAIFLLVFLSALYTGAVIAYPLYLLAGLFGKPEFSDTVMTATQVSGLLFSLVYLRFTAGLNLRSIGLTTATPLKLRTLLPGFAAGLLIILVLALVLFTLGVYDLHPGREYRIGRLTVLLLGALLTGLAVGLFEETLFRGALLRGLQARSNSILAVLATSLVYAAVHFIGYTEPPPGATIGWLTAPAEFIPAYSGVLTGGNYDAFLALALLGVLLGMLRVKSGNILQCIALHAGIVAGIKVFRFVAQYQPDNAYNYLVNPHDYRLGFAAVGVLVLALLVYGYLAFRGRTADNSQG